MPTIDFATTQIFIDENLIDVSFEFAHSEVKEVVHKKFRGIFKKELKAWRINKKFAKASDDQIVADIENALWENAPVEWKPLVERFKGFSCATKRYDVKFAAGGIRLIFPAGHACHYHLKRILGRETKLDTWLVPAKLIKIKDLLPMVQRAEKEDREIVEDALDPYEGRTIRGRILMKPEEAANYNMEIGKVVFADFGFIHMVEPHAEDPKLHYWPFRVLECEASPRLDDPDEVDLEVRLQYLAPSHACKAIRKYMSLPIEDRPWPLDVARVNSKWKAKSA